MDVVIRETGETKELAYMVNGINIAADFVGNNSVYEHDDDGYPVMGADDYGWWVQTIAAHQRMEAEIADHKERYGEAAVNEALSWAHALNCDLGDQPANVHRTLADWFEQGEPGQGERYGSKA